MAVDCPFCYSSRSKTCETRVLASGTRRRRYACHDCQQRWTVHDGPPPRRGARSHIVRSGTRQQPAGLARVNKPPLTDEDVRAILIAGLTQGATSTVLARQFGRTSTAINAILRGDYHRGICPELVRRGMRRYPPDAPICHDCIHWLDGRCGMEFPDPVVEGVQFAADCAAFVLRSNTDLSCR